MSILNKINRYAPLDDYEYQNIFRGIIPRWFQDVDYEIINSIIFVDNLELIPASQVNVVLNRIINDPQIMALLRDRLYEHVKD